VSLYWSYDNLFEGWLGRRWLSSYAFNTIFFGLGDGHDTITDDVQAYYYGAEEFLDDPTCQPVFQDHLILGSGISLQDLTVTQVDYDMVDTTFITSGDIW
jgi:hypothetical protein